MVTFYEIERAIDRSTSSDLVEIISEHALEQGKEISGTISFVFWLVYIVESSLNDAIKDAWENVEADYSDAMVKKMRTRLKDNAGDPKNMEYFKDKIKVFNYAVEDSDDKAKYLWRINDIRNDLSHTRIKDLSYEGVSLYKLKTKKKILKDFFRLFMS